MKRTLTAALGAVGVAVGLATAPPAQADAYDEFYAAADWLAGKYGVDVYVGTAPLDPGTYAQARGATIVLNSYFVAYPAELDAAIASEIATGYSRGRYCSAVQGIAAHEYAHVLDNVTGHSARAELVNALAAGMTGTVSGYAVTSVPEAIAESFVAVECDVPTPAEQAIYDMLTT
ncbi:metallophosphoesterase [Mycobacterium phage Thonko]|uniref:Metallophosphoesterase n=1 Tax=Mycobacterium phage Thonko TaxID=2282910 RepID=A0A346FCD9_9CAUD|nr:zinc-finger protease [Mycobacterium phage Thonko]AXN53364.1 metallophosphoesterase [Mycobacterium phage Thonko]